MEEFVGWTLHLTYGILKGLLGGIIFFYVNLRSYDFLDIISAVHPCLDIL